MKWHYAIDGQTYGPVSEEEFQTLWQRSTIGPHTLVWHEGLPDWVEYRHLTSTNNLALDQAVCSECGLSFPQEDMIRFGTNLVCASCKRIYVQKVKEGAQLVGTMNYAGFWIRFGAKIIDWVILGVAQAALTFSLAFFQDQTPGVGATLIINGLQLIIAAAYTTYFLGRYQATIGKMACQLKVVYDDGSPISYGRALGRHFAEFLSAIILAIGYLMAAFDSERRALHDRICSTRVVHK